MAKIRKANSRVKPTAAGVRNIAEQIGKHPTLTRILADEQKTALLEKVLRSASLSRAIAPEIEAKLEAVIQKINTLKKLEAIVGEVSPGDAMRVYTDNELKEDTPSLNTHFLDFVGRAKGYEELVADLTVHYNYDGLEGGAVNDILYQVHELRNDLLRIAAARERKQDNRLSAA